MARPLRIEYPGAWYHVMNRVAGRGLVFKERWTADIFLRMLQDIDQRFDVECHAYCLMRNRYHLMLRTTEGNLSQLSDASMELRDRSPLTAGRD